MLSCTMQTEHATRASPVTVPGSREQDVGGKMCSSGGLHNSYGWKFILHLLFSLFNVFTVLHPRGDLRRCNFYF